MKLLTKRESAVLFALAAGQIENWREAYIIANQKPEEEVKRQAAINSTASRWKARAEIQTAYKNAVAIVAAMGANTPQTEKAPKIQESGTDEEERTTADNVRTKAEKPARIAGNIDYSNPAEQARKLNELVNTASDPGEALDALKVIISSQRADKEAAREGKRVVFYTPLRCKDCPLYEKAREKAAKRLQ